MAEENSRYLIPKKVLERSGNVDFKCTQYGRRETKRCSEMIKNRQCKNKTKNPSGLCYRHIKNDKFFSPSSVVECQRCSYTRPNGTRCKRTTCRNPYYCYQHLESVAGLRIKKSNIENAGYGLFATRKLDKNSLIPYSKIILDNETVEKMWPDDVVAKYTFKCENGKNDTRRIYYDGTSTQTGPARYINDPGDEKMVNAEFEDCNLKGIEHVSRINDVDELEKTENIKVNALHFIDGEAVNINPYLSVRLTKDVQAGEEIYISYGTEYWD